MSPFFSTLLPVNLNIHMHLKTRGGLLMATTGAVIAVFASGFALFLLNKKKTEKKEITIGYWSIRGLGAPLRMMVMYAGYPLNAVNYDLKPTENNGFDSSCWTSVKTTLKEKNPFINLPYVIDGDKVISQTNACFHYLGRKFNMLGSNNEEMEECEQILCEVMDLRNMMTNFAYNSKSDKAACTALLANVTKTVLQKMETWQTMRVNVKGNSGTFLVGEKASAPDFHVWEMLAQYESLSIYFEGASLLAKLPFLNKFFMEFGSRSENARYMDSKLLQLPFNNKMAAFGATPTGDKWNTGMNYEDWAEISGRY